MARKAGRLSSQVLPYSYPRLQCFSDRHISSNVDPANNTELGTVPEMTLAQTKEAIAAAGIAFKSWSKTTAKVR